MLLHSQCQGDRVAVNAVAVLGLGEQRVGTSLQSESAAVGERPDAVVERAVAQQGVRVRSRFQRAVVVAVEVKGHLQDGAAGIGESDVRGVQGHATAGLHGIGAGREGTNLRAARRRGRFQDL